MTVTTFSTTFELRSVTRDSDDDWEVIEPAHIELWTRAARSLSLRSYVHTLCSASVMVDWLPLVRRLTDLHALRKTAYSESSSKPFDWSPFWEPIALDGSVAIEGDNELSQYDWYPVFFAELYAYDVFTILNLAYPGSCNFLTLTIRLKNGRAAAEPRLGAYSFDFALIDAKSGKWPSLDVLPLDHVANWHAALGLGIKQTAETPVEKVLFAMLHLCRREDYVEAVIWIFYALEALVETRVGESISTLVRRISALLNLTERQRTDLNKKLRKLYDFRSAVVHGGYKVAHPIAQEVIDRNIGDEFGRTIELFQFGFTIIVACLQALIKKGWVDVRFRETIEGGGGAL
ncbi:MAG: hypothetical protein ACSLE5_16130 [Porticoccaceae bacterium]